MSPCSHFHKEREAKLFPGGFCNMVCRTPRLVSLGQAALASGSGTYHYPPSAFESAENRL
jgi:hypothetical protein